MPRSWSAFLALTLSVAAARATPQDPASTWRRPPDTLADVALAPPLPTLAYAPSGRFVLVVEHEALPPLARLARPMERLAGLRIDPATRARFTTDRPARLFVRPLADDVAAREDVALAVPEDMRVTSWSWSLDGRRLALVAEGPTGTSLYVAEPEARGGALTLATARLHPLFVAPAWTTDGDALLVALVPMDGAVLPARPTVPSGPTTVETAGARSPLRTYQDLLQGEADAARFGALARSELALVPAAGGEPVRLAGLGADLWTRASFAPDGRRLLTTRLTPPFSFRQPWSEFAHVVEVHSWDDAAGHRRREVASVPLAAEVPIGGVRTGPRDLAWIPGRESSLVYFEALDGGDPGREAARRDRVVRLDLDRELAGNPVALTETEHRATSVLFTDDPDRYVVAEHDRDRRWNRATLLDGAGRYSPVSLEDRSANDGYGDPGTLVTGLDARGQRVLRREGVWAFRVGAGATPEGERPFLAVQNLETGERRELWRSGPEEYARVVTVLDVPFAGGVFAVLRRETALDPPRDTLLPFALPGAERIERAPREVFAAADPQPALRGVRKELVRYTRPDGVELSAVLYLPPGYAGDTPLPLLVWAYPREYTDAAVAGQVRGSANRFTLVSGASHLSLCLMGFAVLDDAAMPILGDPETMNDTFLPQLVASAAAAIDFCVARGVAQHGRVAVGGHSYGAFMTANLLAHSDLFAAGVARSGAYNRTLTPFGFQSERRPLWEARETYLTLSPFLHAGGIQEPLLLIHGAADSNSGTFPEQSERLFAALQGLGGTARLVLLPHEDHGYRSREAVLHTLAETYEWLQRYVVER